MLVTCEQMASAEQAAFDSGLDQAALMQQAGNAVAEVVLQQHPRPGTALLFVGKGNNGGDALVAGRKLLQHGWEVRWRLSSDHPDELKPLPRRHLLELQSACPDGELPAPIDPHTLRPGDGALVVIDGLLGIGTGGNPRGVIARRISEILALRQKARVIAVDLPSGFDADTGEAGDHTVIADTTVTFGFLKTGFVRNNSERWLGRLVLVPLPGVPAPEQADDRLRLVTADEVAAWLPRRDSGWHKGRAGRVAVIAGSVGSAGAGVLTATAALKSGAGLVTLWTRPEVWSVAAAMAPPELMVRPIENHDDWSQSRPDALVIGPGLGLDEWARLVVATVWQHAEMPLVVDADALTLLSRDPSVWKQHPLSAAAPRILTPHPGELARLLAALPQASSAGGSSGQHVDPAAMDRFELALHLATSQQGCGCTWLLKGGHTLVADPATRLWLSATGNPGMASGGMGDALAGVTCGLLAQGLEPWCAASAAAWLNGRAAELALTSGQESLESLTAGEVIRHLGPAFDSARAGCW